MASDLFENAKERAKLYGNRDLALRALAKVPVENRPLVLRAINEVFPVGQPTGSFVEGLAGLDPASVAAQLEAARPVVRHGLPVAGQVGGGALGAILGGPLGGVAAEAIGGAGGEKLAQSLGLADPSLTNVLLAGAAPPLARTGLRVGRAVGRTATRLVPSLFQRAQAKAMQAADELVTALEPSDSATELFNAARAAGAERVQAGRLTSIIDDLAKSIPDDPVNPGLKTVREFMSRLQGVVSEGTASLEDLMRLRLDLGRSLTTRGGAPELRRLYGGVLESLEESAKAGGEGATFAKQALDTFKKDLGVVKFKEILESPQVTRQAALGAKEALSIRNLATQVQKNRAELGQLLGEGGLNLIDAFVNNYRALPPETAFNYANSFLMLLFGGGGAATTGPLGAALGLAPELVKNVFAVGRNPEVAARILATLAQSARLGATPETPKFINPLEGVTVGP